MRTYKEELEFCDYNPKSIVLICKVILTIILMNAFMNIVVLSYFHLEVNTLTFDNIFFIPYALLATVIFLSLLFIRKKTSIPEKYVVFFTLIVLLLSGWITLLDQIFYKHQLIYTVVLVLCANFIVLSRKKMCAIIFTSSFILICATFFTRAQNDVYYLHIIFLISLTFLAFVISIGIRSIYKQLISSKVQLKVKAEEAEQASEQLRQMNEYLYQLARLDTLTGIPNRSAYNEYRKQIFSEDLKQKKTIAVLFVDIDYFKEYNDFYGHLVGDEALLAVGQLLKQCAQKEGAFIARWGGEEFILILENAVYDNVEQLCRDITLAMETIQMAHEKSVISHYLTVSIGCSMATISTNQQFDKILQQADDELYIVKNEGRNAFRIVEINNH